MFDHARWAHHSRPVLAACCKPTSDDIQDMVRPAITRNAQSAHCCTPEATARPVRGRGKCGRWPARPEPSSQASRAKKAAEAAPQAPAPAGPEQVSA